MGETTLSTNVYSDDIKGELKEVQYGNGAKTRYAYDDFGRIIGTAYDDSDPATDPKYEYVYDASGSVAIVKDNELGTKLVNTVDIANRPYNSILYNASNNVVRRTLYSYNLRSLPRVIKHELSGATLRTDYTYDIDDRITQLKFNNSTATKIDYTYDLLNRITNKSATNTVAYNTAYTYVQGDTAYGETATTPLVESITQGTGENAMNFFYAYDNRGNIISETRNSVTTTYEYDALGQLTRVNDPNDPTAEVTGTTWVYAYDRGGNILHKTAYNYTTEALPETYVRRWHYTYADNNWKDKLTAFDSIPITYDAIGNPLNDGTWTYTWEKGRQLKSMHNAATGVTMEFTYNHEGIRTQKVKKVNDEIVETTDYLLYGKKIIRMTKGSDTLLFHYDEKGSPIMMRMNGTPYTYVKNLQGDIVGLIDSTGTLVVEYKYDAWGSPISTRTLTSEYDVLAELNPFRYRGYVWDAEMNCCYLNSRYYGTNTNRFLNQDILINSGNGLLSKNMFVYCANNSLNRSDPSGFSWTNIVNGAKSLVRNLLDGGDELLTYWGIDTDAIGAKVLGFYESGSGIYHANKNCWQQYFGYNQLYDICFDIGTTMETMQIEFMHEGEEYIFWAWKGDYINLGAGAELGLYVGGYPHWLADPTLSMPVYMALIYDGECIISHQETTWWMTGLILITRIYIHLS